MFEKILVPLDGSELAECALPYAEEMARNNNSEVILVSVTEKQSGKTSSPEANQKLRSNDKIYISENFTAGPSANAKSSLNSIYGSFNDSGTPITFGKMEKQAQRYLNRIGKSLGRKNLKVHGEVLIGNPAKEIADFAENNDINLIVMSSHGRSGPSRWAYGSVADKVFRVSCVPILMIRAPGCFIGN